MTKQAITVENFTEAMEKAVAIRGADFTYPDLSEATRAEGWYDRVSCRYFRHNGEPACIIGTALSLLGYGPEDIPEGLGARLVLPDLGAGYLLTSAADAAQTWQDGGFSWGVALEAYHEKLKPKEDSSD